MYPRRILAFTLLLPAILTALAVAAGPVAASADPDLWGPDPGISGPPDGTLSIYFDSGLTRTELTDIEPGTPVAFYVVAEGISPGGLSGFSFGVEVDMSMHLLGLAPVAGVSIPVDPIEAGGTRFEAFAAPDLCVDQAQGGATVVAEGFGIWQGPGPNGDTVIDLGPATRIEPRVNRATWFECGTSERIEFADAVDGRIGPSGGPECRLSQSVVRFGNVLTGNTATRTFTITNDGGGLLEGEIPPACDGVTVTAGAGPFSLAYGQVHRVELEITPPAPGELACLLPTGSECGAVAITGTVIDPADIGEPSGVLSVYLNSRLTKRELTGETPGATHSIYVTAEGLPDGAAIEGYEVSVGLAGFHTLNTVFNPPGSTIIASGGVGDCVALRNSCPPPNANGKDVLFYVSATMLTTPDDYAVTISPSGASESALDGRPVWQDCDGTIHPFAELRAARIEYVNTGACVRGPESVPFGRVFTGSARTRAVVLTNTGTEPASGTLSVDCSAFTIVAGADYDLAPLESHEVTVRFAPAGAEEYGCALSGGPMCSAVFLSGRGTTPRPIGLPEGALSVYFNGDPAQTELVPHAGLFGSVHVRADGFDAGFDGMDGFELALTLPGEMIVAGGGPYPFTVQYDDGGNPQVVFLVDLASCAGGGAADLARVDFVYLPLFPCESPFEVTATAVEPSLFDPPAPGWLECGGGAHPFAVTTGATVQPWSVTTPAAPEAFTRDDDGATVTLNWAPQADASAWRVFRGDTPDFIPGRDTFIAETGGTSYTETVPDPARYTYRLSAVDAGGVGGPSIASTPAIVAVAITAFDARATAPGRVELEWDVFADEAFAGFRVRRAREDGPGEWTSELLPPRERAFTDTAVEPGADYRYTLAAVRSDGSEVHSIPARVSVPGVRTALLGGFPNPFNPSTTVRFMLAARARVRVDVFDAAGHRVATLADGTFPAGLNHVAWDGSNRAGTPSASGVYFVRLSAPGVRETKKITLLK